MIAEKVLARNSSNCKFEQLQLRGWQSSSFQYNAAAKSEPTFGRHSFWDGPVGGSLILGIAILGARAEAQDTSFMDMNMNMGCMLMAGMHEMQLWVFNAATEVRPAIPFPGRPWLR